MLGHLMTGYIYDIIREDDENPIRNIHRHPKNLNLTGPFYSITRKQISAGNNLQYQVDTLEKYIYYLEGKIEKLENRLKTNPDKIRPNIKNEKIILND